MGILLKDQKTLYGSQNLGQIDVSSGGSSGGGNSGGGDNSGGSTTVAVTGVTISGPTSMGADASTVQLTATVTPSNATNKTVTWSSDNTSLATVSSSGLVTRVGTSAGTVGITATAGGVTSTKHSIAIAAKSGSGTGGDTDYVPVERVSIATVLGSNEKLEAVEGATAQFKAVVYPENATEKGVVWSSSNTSLFTVDDTGLVTRTAATTNANGKLAMAYVRATSVGKDANGKTITQFYTVFVEFNSEAAGATFPTNAFARFEGDNLRDDSVELLAGKANNNGVYDSQTMTMENVHVWESSDGRNHLYLNGSTTGEGGFRTALASKKLVCPASDFIGGATLWRGATTDPSVENQFYPGRGLTLLIKFRRDQNRVSHGGPKGWEAIYTSANGSTFTPTKSNDYLMCMYPEGYTTDILPEIRFGIEPRDKTADSRLFVAMYRRPSKDGSLAVSWRYSTVDAVPMASGSNGSFTSKSIVAALRITALDPDQIGNDSGTLDLWVNGVQMKLQKTDSDRVVDSTFTAANTVALSGDTFPQDCNNPFFTVGSSSTSGPDIYKDAKSLYYGIKEYKYAQGNFFGEIDHASIFNRGLTDAEMRAAFAVLSTATASAPQYESYIEVSKALQESGNNQVMLELSAVPALSGYMTFMAQEIEAQEAEGLEGTPA